MDPIDGDQLRGHLEAMILATLERDPAHGLEILRRLDDAGCGLLRLKEGSLYPALYRLEAAGAVRAAWEPAPAGRRGARRRLYQLTPKGQRTLARDRVRWQHFVSVLGRILGVPT
jgi:DNA-binding PadR family transcriptional regulator